MNSFNSFLYVDPSNVSQELMLYVKSIWHKVGHLVTQSQLFITRTHDGANWLVSKKDGTCSFQSENLEVAVLKCWSLSQNM